MGSEMCIRDSSDTISENKETKIQLKKEMGEIKVRLQTSDEAPLLNKIEAQPENLKLFDYINSQIEEKEKELECPVCLEVAAAPIFSCEDQHIICSHCRPKVKHLLSKLSYVECFSQVSTCPMCRELYPAKPRRHRYAEKAAEELSGLEKERGRILDN